MGKNKLKKFADMETLECVYQYPFATLRDSGGCPLRGRWDTEVFGAHKRPLTLELGCGKGEYAVGMGRLYPSRSFIGIDIKGARMWTGARQVNDEGLDNVAFLRTSIHLLPEFFAPAEVSEIWITFPDPQLKSRRAKKRLTSPLFLARYARMLTPDGAINLKTDSQHLYKYTSAVIDRFGLPCETSNDDIYGSGFADETLSVKTAYEQMFLSRKLPITYTRFRLDGRRDFEPFDWEGDEILFKDAEPERAGL